jgi:PAS domain S-box-containing protein
MSSNLEYDDLQKCLDILTKQLKSVFDKIPVLVYVIEPKTHKILYANEYLNKLAGTDAVGRLCYEIFHLSDKPCETCYIQNVIKRSSEPYIREYHNVELDRYYLVVSKMVSWLGEKDVLFGFAIDITERKELEKQIDIEKEYFKQLFVNSPEAIVIADRFGAIEAVNKYFTKMFGYTEEEVKGRCIDDLIVPILYSDDARLITKMVSEGETISIEAIRRDKEGKEINVSILCHPILMKGEVVKVYGIYRDITERKKAEEELNKRIKELEDFYDLAVSREMRIIELKKEVEGLKEELERLKSK